MLVQISNTRPPSPQPRPVHVFETILGPFVLVVDGSRVYSIDKQIADRLKSEDPHEVLNELGLGSRSYITDDAPIKMPVRSLSLAIAQKCNLGCVYCYAQEGSFGVEPKNMEQDVALAAVK